MQKTKKKLKRGTPEYIEFMREAGRKGGNATKRNQLFKDPDYYAKIGLKGGLAMKNTRGNEFYSAIGKMGSRKQWHGEARS